MASIGRCVQESGHYYAYQMGCKIIDSCTGVYMTPWFECYRATEMLVGLQAQGRCTDCPPPPCVPAWGCETPLTGYEADGCGNKRANPACNPPQIGSISFVSTPPGAEIFIDGADQGVITPNTVSSIPVGIHAYTLRLAGYNAYTGSINVTLNQTASVTATLITACTPVWRCELPLAGIETDGCGNSRPNPACNPPQTGSISFTSTPAGAEIFIDGADQGIKTPATISNIPLGTHTYTLKQTGYNDVTGTANVGLNQTAVASATLMPVAIPGIGAGTVMVLLLAAGALATVILGSGKKTTIVARPPGGHNG